eukprot:EG_transcript_33538
MSWQTYVDVNLVGSGHNQYAAIISLADGKLLATSAGFSITPDEVTHLGRLLRSPQEAARGTIVLAATAYPVRRVERDALYGRQGNVSCCVALSKACLVVAVSRETSPEAGPALCEGVRDYLLCTGR